jgi:hypothetical protein
LAEVGKDTIGQVNWPRKLARGKNDPAPPKALAIQVTRNHPRRGQGARLDIALPECAGRVVHHGRYYIESGVI